MLKLNCVQATRLLSESQDRELGVSERTVLRVHTWICSGCRTFGGQLGFLRQAMKGYAAHEGEPWSDAASQDAHGDEPPPGGGM